MIRKQFFIDADQNRRLKVLAERTGKSEGEVIREGIETVLSAHLVAEDWRSGLGQLSGAWNDREDMQDLVRTLRKGGSRRLARLGLIGSDRS